MPLLHFADVRADAGAIRRAMRSKIANSSGSEPRSVTSACTRAVSSTMARARTTTCSPSMVSEPTTTCVARTSRPIRMTVASVSDAAGGTCSRSNATRRSSRVMALTPSALRSSASSTDAASPSHTIRPSREAFSNGITRMRLGVAWAAVCASPGAAVAPSAAHTITTMVAIPLSWCLRRGRVGDAGEQQAQHARVAARPPARLHGNRRLRCRTMPACVRRLRRSNRTADEPPVHGPSRTPTPSP